MTSFSAKSDTRKDMPFEVLFLIYPDIVLLDLAGPLQVFAGAQWPDGAGSAYRTSIASLEGGPTPTDTVVTIEAEPLESWIHRDIHTLVVAGGNGANAAMRDKTFVSKVTELASRAERVSSVCSGALILASAGLLDGRRATTHWQDCAHLQNEFPETQVEMNPIYVKDGIIWTSAGITAGIDMALAMVAEDIGPQAALKLAQSLLVYMVRHGGQSQFSPALQRQWKDSSGKFDALHRWMEEHLHKMVRIEDLAAQANMSLRNFHRQYSLQMGITPAKALELLRIERARSLLEIGEATIKSVAARSGFGDEERMRRAFVRVTGIHPTEHRRRFRLGAISKADTNVSRGI